MYKNKATVRVRFFMGSNSDCGCLPGIILDLVLSLWGVNFLQKRKFVILIIVGRGGSVSKHCATKQWDKCLLVCAACLDREGGGRMEDGREEAQVRLGRLVKAEESHPRFSSSRQSTPREIDACRIASNA